MKYRLLTFIFMFFVCLTVVGQVNQVWWSKGRVLHVNLVAGIDSVTFGQFVNADTFLIVIDRASRRIVYDTIDDHVPGMVFHDTIHTTHTVYLEPGRRIGVFSVAKDRQVSFSQGNLQYVRNQDVWKFADQQYEYIGAGNVKDGELANKIDLFGWSADNTTAPFGVSTSTDAADYSGDFVDWGVNEINIDAPNTWRTLSQEEWGYIFESRKNAKQLYSKGSIDGVRGMIVLPDDWVLPEGLHFTAAPDNLTMDLDINIYTRAQWQKMEEAGAVFLCPTGRRDGLNIGYLVEYGGYWSSSRSGSNRVKHLYFNYQSLVFNTNYNSGDQSYGYNGRAVRLVHDTIVPPPAPCKTFDVNGVEFNMMCVEGGTFTMGKGEDAHQVTLSDYYMAQSELTQAQWEAVMGKIEKGKYAIEKYGDNYPMSGISLMQCQEFVDRLNELTGLHFRISTEAEWEYAARGGVKSKGYKYAGSDDINEVAIWNGTVRLDENGKNIYAPEPVMTRKPNELGIYDMSGNVAEWVNDWNGEFNLYPQINPTGPTTYTTTYSHRVHYRGGCWTFPEYKCEVTFKQPKNVPSITDPNRGFNGTGLRLVLSDEEPFKMVYLNDSTRIVLRQVKGGTFMMGATADDAEAEADEKPQHEVTLSDYYIGQTEVTQQLWQTVMGYNPSSVKGDNLPVESVSWDECQQFVEKLSQMTGLYFRLPTEAEWEYAARGGNRSKGYTYAGSNNADSVAWHIWNTTSLQEVGQLQSNELGIYDMTGNVWEYCSDYYAPYPTEAQVNPQGPQTTSSKQRVTRGGGWRQNPGFDTSLFYCRVINRASLGKSDIVGLRIVLDERSVFDEPKPSKRIGVFSVAKDRQVSFSQGNLQYVRNQDVWKFADQQYEYIGAGNVKDGELANKIDLFGWSADNTTAPFGVSTSVDNTDYLGDFVDWSVNEINIDKPNMWRTLSRDEWEYLLNERENAKTLRGRAQVAGVNGFVFLPDNWISPEGIELNLDEQATKVFTIDQWHLLENAGAVFLPAAGRRQGMELINLNDHGNYWSSTRKNSNYAEYFAFTHSTNKLYVDAQLEINLGRSVRLVYDTIVPSPAPCETFEVNGVEFNMMCVEGGTFTMGAGSDAHQVTLSDYLIAETELTQELWEAVMNESYDTILSTHNLDVFQKGPNYPAYGLTWYDAQEFIERLNKLTGLQFRMPTEAEWEYAARGGKYSKGYKYAGSDNIDEVAWHALNSDNQMHIVATKKPNELGIYDMTGNSWELCLDGYAAYPTYSQTNPLVPLKTETVVRGGSSYSSWDESNYLITYRLNRAPNALHNRNTLRLVLSGEVVVKTIVIDNKMAFNMRMVDGGTFMMGATADDADAEADEKPQHEVTLSDYYIGQTEVTQELWTAVMGTTLEEERKKGGGETGVGEGDKLPMYCMSWYDCQDFIAKLNAITGLKFRLPTEAEWEFAARGGNKSRGFLYSGSDNADEVAWHSNLTNGQVKEVGTLKANELGIYDMSGNVWEWVLDGYQEYSLEESYNPVIPIKGQGVLRGGSTSKDWGIRYLRVSERKEHPLTAKRTRSGFRIVLDKE